MLFITGSNGIYAGKDLYAKLPSTTTPFGTGVWDGINKYSWTAYGINDLMPIFTNLKGKLNIDYVALKFTTSNYNIKDHPYRVCFMEDGNTDPIAQIWFYLEGDKNLVFANRDELKDKDLSKVDKILFGGLSASGSITLDPKSIVLVGQSKITVSPNDTNKGTVYFTVGDDAAHYTNKTVPNHTSVKFYANPNNEKVVFTGWGGEDGKGNFVSPVEVKDVTKDLEFIANFVDGIHIKCTVDPSNAAEPDVYQKGHPEWGMPSDGYVAPGQATTFAFKNQQERYNFLGWYDETGKELTKKTTYSLDQINEETKVIAKFSTDIQNNTQRYDLSTFELTNQGGNVQSAAYDATEKALKVMTKGPWNNYFPLYKDLTVTDRTGTGVRLTAKGVTFRIVVKTSENKDFHVIVPESNSYVTSHYKWEDFNMTKDDVAKITQIGLAGNNGENETDREFSVQEFWLDDIADYDKTIPCYGEEGGKWDWAKNSFVYKTAGATAVFEESNTRDANHNIILKPNKKVTLSSDVSKFTEVCLVFGDKTTYDLTVAGTQYTGTSTAVICPVNSSELEIRNNSSSDNVFLSKIIYSSEKVGINEERTITVDVDGKGKTRRYWLYVPASLAGQENVPVVFSLHGRSNNDNPNQGGKPVFTSLANEKGFIVVYPQGRNAGDEQDKKDYPGDDWKKGFGDTTGWEATGKENADTKFIKALVEEIQKEYKTQTSSNSNISVDPKRFYLCGFSMGGMMTYACAKVLNGTFAAYGSCGGFPLNEFHMNLATENPIPFIHLHGKDDTVVDIKLLHTIIENLLFRNGCKLSAKQNNDDGWTTTTENGITRNDFKGVNGVPVTTVTFEGLGHSVHQSAPAYLWDFFSDKTVGKYDDSDIEWKWDMPTINANITESSSKSYYGWNHEVNGDDRSLTYGGKDNTDGNHNVYNSIQLTPGKHTLYAKMASRKGVSSVTLRNILTGAETVARKVVDNSGTQTATDYNVLYEFEVGEGAEFSLELKRSDTNSACTLLEIHKGSYRQNGVKDDSQDNASINLENGKLAELTFEKDEKGEDGVDITPITEKSEDKYKVANSSDNGNMKLYLISRLHNGAIDNKDKYIVKDPVFGHYFQNIPDADIYDRYGASDYMRVVLGENNSLSGHKDKDGKDIDGIQKTGKVTIGFWVNGDIAVNRGLAYDEPSMFYIAGETYNGENKVNNPHMFNITCNGGLSGYMKVNDGEFEYHSGASSFGGLCPESKEDFYSKNFYKDCNWHYITYQMYDNLSRYNMYVDGEPTCLGGYATHKAQSLDECISGLKSIVLGGANANNVKFAYDVAFAYDDIVIYNRVLSKREINKIIEDKKYSPSVWHFDRNLENKIFFNPENLKDQPMWASSSDGVYTLNTDFTSAAALTYDGITEIPAFKGLRFVTNGGQKIKIDAKNGALHLSQGVKVVFSNLATGNYVRMEYKNNKNVDWNGVTISKMVKPLNIPSPSDGCTRQAFKVMKAETGEENSITMPSAIDIIRMEATDKYFAQIKFVDNNNNVVSVVKDPADEKALPRMDLYVNAVERMNPRWDGTSYNFKYTSSSPHVASIDADGKVTLHGIAGSTVITAELINDENKYDCDIYDQYAFEPSNRIFSSYEIVVEPKDGTFCKVADGETYTVGQTLYNDDRTVGVTLGGWTYNNGSYYDDYHDSYTAKESWEGQKFEKNADRNGYLANSRKTEEDVFHEFFTDKDEDGKYKKETFSTNGSFAAKSEQLTKDYAATGNYSAPTNNKSVANATPWLLPCRGSHIKIEPTDAGLISVYVMQEGCVSHAPSGEPIDVTVKKVYVADEKGEIVKEVVADTKSKVAAQMHKDDGRARAEYFWGDPELAYNEATMNSFLKIDNFADQWSFLDNWPNPGMQQHVFKLGNDEDGHVLITKGIVRYTFNVLPGKTYYIFSNTAKLGLAGFTFEPGKHAIYHKVKPDAKHDEWRATGDFVNVSKDENGVTLDDTKDYSALTKKNVDVTLKRTFYKNYWNAICLPYSINRRQIEKVFGDGTMVVLMKNIDTSKKKVMFIEHVNQDIIAGYPYLIFPTKKDDNVKTDHSEINGITTRATFGEADSPIFTVGTDGTTYTDGKMQSDALVFKGTFTNAKLNEGSYVVTNKGVLSRIPKDEMPIKPYRSYIYFNRETAGAKAISLQNMNVNGFENEEDNTTGIENLLFESGILTHSADVYSIDGQLVRSKALNLNGLPKGVYIVNGKKYVKK